MLRLSVGRLARTAVLAGLVVLAGCASSSGGRTAGSGRADVVIVNGSNETVYRIYMSPSAQRQWGPDQLGRNVLAVGQSFRLTNISPGRWDIRIEDRSGNWKEFRRQTFRGGRTYTLRVNSRNWNR